MDDQKKPRTTDGKSNQGEGNREADVRYRNDAERFAKEHDTEELGRRAAADIEKDNSSYREAEELGKARTSGADPDVQNPDRRKA